MYGLLKTKQEKKHSDTDFTHGLFSDCLFGVKLGDFSQAHIGMSFLKTVLFRSAYCGSTAHEIKWINFDHLWFGYIIKYA